MKRILFYTSLFIFIFCLPVISGSNKKLTQAVRDVADRIKQEAGELERLREKNSAQRVALKKKIDTAAREVVRQEHAIQELTVPAQEHSEKTKRLKSEIRALEKQLEFCASLLGEYRRNMGEWVDAAARQRYSQELEAIDDAIDVQSENSETAAVDPLLKFLRRFTAENTQGSVFSGRAADRTGTVLDGRFVTAGPVTFFTSNQPQGPSGMTGTGRMSELPEIIQVFDNAPVTELAQGKTVEIPIDFTLGGAARIEQLEGGLTEHIEKGGIIMIPILGLGVLCVLASLWKILGFAGLKTGRETEISRIASLLRDENIAEAEKAANALGRPVGAVIQEGVRNHNAHREHLEEVMHERILFQIPFLERGLSILAVSAAASPLLGLLGTVTGMIHTFNLVTVFGTGKAKLLSGGISEALITTEFGLIIAVPALIIHAYFSRKVRKSIRNLEQSALLFINRLKS